MQSTFGTHITLALSLLFGTVHAASLAVGNPTSDSSAVAAIAVAADEDLVAPELHWRSVPPSNSDDISCDIGDDAPGKVYNFASSVPLVRSFCMRAEFESQSGLLISGMLCNTAPNVLRRIGQELKGTTPLVILVNNEDELQRSASELAGINNNHRFLLAKHDSIWTRDYGPTVLTERMESLIVDTSYEEERPNDDTIPDHLSLIARTQSRKTSLRLPGGNLLTNGRRLCITTTRVQQENPERTQPEIARSIASLYGANAVAILDPLIEEATGHVDMFATFTDPFTVVVGMYDPNDEPENAAILDRNAAVLASIRVGNRKLRVVRVPMPSRIGEQVLTFTNVVYANGKLFVPAYASTDSAQRKCVRQFYTKLLPGWDVCFVSADDLVCDGGALHCVVSNLSSLPISLERPLPRAAEIDAIHLTSIADPLRSRRQPTRLGKRAFNADTWAKASTKQLEYPVTR